MITWELDSLVYRLKVILEALLSLGLIFTLVTLVDQFLVDRLHMVLHSVSAPTLVIALGLITGICLAKMNRVNMCLKS